MESVEFWLRARRAYEVGRLKRALRTAAISLPLVVLSVVVGDDALVSLVVGAALMVSCTLALWRGQVAGAAVRPGLLAGLFPFALLLTLRCGSFCDIGGCSAHWVGFCGFGGLVAGLVLAARARRVREGALTFLVTGGAIAALTGLLACFMGGIMGAFWMALGELAAAVPAFAVQLRRR